METYEIVGRQVILLSILVLYLGSFITKRSLFLQNNNIPVAVTGGLICAIVLAMLSSFGVATLTFDLSLRDLLLLLFFSTIGLNAKFKYLLMGGYALIILVFVCAIFLVFQNIIGLSIAKSMGFEPFFGLLGGSISLAGGHGTSIAWGEIATDKGIEGAAEFGIACATFGLILGGLIGGPIAGRLIKKHSLEPIKDDLSDIQEGEDKPSATGYHKVTADDIINTIFALALCLGLGDAVNRYFFSYEIRLPGFLTALMAGIILTNLSDSFKIKLNHNGIDLIGGVSLQLFLAMSLMSMDLLSLADSALLLAVTMSLQVLIITFFAVKVVFRFMGSDYDAAIITSGFIGLGLGATPVAIANMDAVSQRYGPSLKALLIVPIVGAFFIDIINSLIIQAFLKIPFL